MPLLCTLFMWQLSKDSTIHVFKYMTDYAYMDHWISTDYWNCGEFVYINDGVHQRLSNNGCIRVI